MLYYYFMKNKVSLFRFNHYGLITIILIVINANYSEMLPTSPKSIRHPLRFLLRGMAIHHCNAFCFLKMKYTAEIFWSS